jgi:tRNA(Ser,Leu) C12 N-acetylase TAN1
MEDYPGFVISSARTQEKNASSEMYYVLSELLDQEEVNASPVSGISGLSIVTFQGDSIQVLKKLQEMIEDNPLFQYTLKIVPFQYKVSTSIENLKEAATKLSTEIDEANTWKINVRRRHTQIPRNEIIGAIANVINKGKVMLESPDHYVIVEIIGKWTYLAVSSIPELSISISQFHEEEDDFTF